RDVTIASANVIQQALNLGLVDEIAVSLVPVLFGEGKTYFGRLDGGHLMLEDPRVVQGRRALHLTFQVRR
ncbi:MAG TPA: dihydrofolate reductase family protein, partial [Candidatus Limnocylindrales bacterium]|nr:dihydrofolate reductase family protein [Candidatus Limnocylindrales bacterium]